MDGNGFRRWMIGVIFLIGSPVLAGELNLPDGFEASVFHPGVGRARHIAIAENGDIYVRLATSHANPGVLRLRDGDGDGRADSVRRVVSDQGGTGIEIRNGQLFYSTNTAVYSLPLGEKGEEEQAPPSPRKVIGGFSRQGQHAAKSLALTADGRAFVNVGAPSNACQEESRTPGSPGRRPCPLLERHGGVWSFDPDKTGQAQGDADRFVTGMRNAVALAWHPVAESLYLVQHGRDQLYSLWPAHYTTEENAALPAEEFHRVEAGDDLGWPYTYYDGSRDRRMQAPEYGGDGEMPAKEDYREPLVAFPAHWAPNDLVFYTGTGFPEKYRNGAFVAFHGSWNRAPEPQAGYRVTFVPMNEEGEVVGQWQDFATGFAGVEVIRSPSQARHRPMGLAVGPGGNLYVADSVAGRIWKIRFTGASE
jgi:glucose/arabinose dehydrogenase